MGETVLQVLAVLCAIFATMVVFMKNAIYSALSLLVVFFFLAVIYGMIGSHFVAGVQLIVYAGAVMVLFVFAIMLLQIGKEDGEYSLFSPRALISFVSAAGLMFVLGRLPFSRSIDPNLMENGPLTPAKIDELGGNVKVLANALFREAYLPFELVSLVLLLAIVGAVVLAKRKLD